MELTEKAKDILGKIDFYKVGHHGSANATPKGAVAAMCVTAMFAPCSTQIEAYSWGVARPALQAGRRDGWSIGPQRSSFEQGLACEFRRSYHEKQTRSMIAA
jgi:hypothetical protein